MRVCPSTTLTSNLNSKWHMMKNITMKKKRVMNMSNNPKTRKNNQRNLQPKMLKPQCLRLKQISPQSWASLKNKLLSLQNHKSKFQKKSR